MQSPMHRPLRAIILLSVVFSFYPISLSAQAADLTIECGSALPSAKTAKPALDVQGLPTPPNNNLMDPTRVIGFATSGGKLVLVASPAVADCNFNQKNLGKPVGVVWSFDVNGALKQSYIVAVDINN